MLEYNHMKELLPSQPLLEIPSATPSAEAVFTPRDTSQKKLSEKLKELDMISRNNPASIAREKLQHIQETTKDTNYFFQARLEQLLKKPLADWGSASKRFFIKTNWSITFDIIDLPILSKKADFPQEILACWV